MTARRLAAILAADVVGYSRLMGEDEAGTAGAVRERRAAAEPIAAAHGGRIFKTMGDAIFIEFPSIVSAVECALAIQDMMAARNAGLAPEKRLVFRIGVHLGDVLVEGAVCSATGSISRRGSRALSGALDEARAKRASTSP